MLKKLNKKLIAIFFEVLLTTNIFASSLVLDPNSKNNTKLDVSATGIPIVNISTPNSRGVSVNDFLEYNVDKKGQVLNNADNVGRSHLAGLINSNPNLAPNQAAGLIVLQVNGANRSDIEGYIEALSREKVNVILSNQNGIYFDGAGTINIKNFTATTGKVNLQNGDYVGIDVEKGRVVIGPKGFDGTNADYVSIISKALELQGSLVANKLDVVAGSNIVDKDGNITNKNAVNNSVAIDAHELGSMYAGQVKLIVTDEGAGVKSDSFITSRNKKLEITADGKIHVTKIQGEGIDVKARDYEQNTSALSSKDINISANSIKLNGDVTKTAGNLVLDGNVENNANISADGKLNTKNFSNTKTVVVGKEITTNGSFDNSGKIQSKGAIAVFSNAKNTGEIEALSKIDVKGNVENHGKILTDSTFTSKDVKTTNKLIAKDKIEIGNLENSGFIGTNKNLKIDGSLKNSKDIQVTNEITVKGNALNTGIIATQSSFTAKDTKTTNKLVAKDKIQVDNLDNSGLLVTDSKLDVNGTLKNSDKIKVSKEITVKDNAENIGEILTNSSFSAKDTKNTNKLNAIGNINTANLINEGELSTQNKLNVVGNLTNKKDIQVKDNITITGNVDNDGTILTDANFSSKDINNKKNLIASKNILSANVDNSGVFVSGDKIEIKGSLNNSKTVETKKLSVDGNNLTNSKDIKAENIFVKTNTTKNTGDILSSKDITIETGKLENSKKIAALNNISANNTKLTNSGEIVSNNKIELNNSELSNSDKILSNTVEMKNAKNFSNTGTISGVDTTLTSDQDINLVADLHGENNLVIKGKNILNNGKTTSANSIDIKANNFTNKKELSTKNLKIVADSDVENENILSGQSLNISAKNINNKDLIGAEKSLTINASEKVLNNQGKTLYSNNDLTIKAKDIENQRGEILAKNIKLEGANLLNKVGTIQAFNDININVDNIQNIGQVDNLDNYDHYYETWDFDYLTSSEINGWKRDLGGPSIGRDQNSRHRAKDDARPKQRDKYQDVSSRMLNDKNPSLLFSKYKDRMDENLGDEPGIILKTQSAEIPKAALKERLISKATTNHGKILAGNDININSKNLLNKDSIISAKNNITINSDTLNNLVTTSKDPIRVKTGEEIMDLTMSSRGLKFTRHGIKFPKATANAKYTRDFQNDWIKVRVPVLDEYGNHLTTSSGKKRYKYIDKYVGRYAYVTADPSIIEGKEVNITGNIVDNQVIDPTITEGDNRIDEAQGKIRINRPITHQEINSKNIAQGNSKTNATVNIASNQINIPTTAINDPLNSSENRAEIYTNTQAIRDILKSGKIDILPALESSLFIENVKPTSKYIMETRLKYIAQSSYYGSDYFLDKINYNPNKWDKVKRLGDAFYENQLIERTIIEKLGTRFLNGKALDVKNLIDNAEIEAKKQNLIVGTALTKEQIKNLDKDILWYEYQQVNGLKVLAPKVYLSQSTIAAVKNDGKNRIAGTELTSIKADKVMNNGVIGNTGKTLIQANEIKNKSIGDYFGEITGDKTSLIAFKNLSNSGAKISATEELVLIAKNITNESTTREIAHNNSDLDRSRFNEIASAGQISSNGLTYIEADKYTSKGAFTSGEKVVINAKDVNLNSIELTGEQKFGTNSDNFQSYGFKKNVGSELQAKDLQVSADNLNIKASTVKTDTALIDVKNIKLESGIDYKNREKQNKSKGFLSSSSEKEKSHQEFNSESNLIVKNQGILTGNIEVIGSTLALGDNSLIVGKLTTDSQKLNSTYEHEKSKKGFSASITSNSFSVGYGKTKTTTNGKDLTNDKSTLILGDGTVLNKGAEITATNFEHGKISINNGDVTFGARKDIHEIESSTKSSGINLSVKIKSEAVDRAKQGIDSFKQMKSGDILGGIASSTNTVTGVVQGLSGNITKKDGSKATLNDIKADDFKVNNNFYADVGVNLGFNKTSSNSKSHNESAVVTTIKGKDENSSITYNNVNTVNYDGTQAKNTKFIYNNVENINKTAVELNNYNRSSSKSTGVSAGLSFDEQGKMNVDAVRVSASGSKMNTDETIYQNGSFINVDEVHNNTKNMTLSGFNQEGGTVTGNIENLTIESKQNTSVTKGSSYSASVGVSPSGTVSGDLSLSKTNGERRYVDTPSSFIVGENSNLSIGKAENTAAIIGTTDNGKIKINEYIGKNLDNIDKMKTVGASVGTSYSKGSNPTLTGVGVNYSNSDLRSTTKNTVVGNVEIGKSSGDEINRDINAMIEITKDDKTNTNVNLEAQTIDYLSNLNKFKEDLELSIVESKATATSIVKKIDNILTNGDDIGQNEKRTLLEIKQSVMEAQNLNQIDIIANTEYSAKDLQDKLGVTIEKFDPNSEDLSLAVKERIEELKELGIKETGSPYSLEAFYDKSTGKIFINKDISDDKLRPAIAREWKIKEDLKNNLGKENSQGKLKSTTAGAIAYREVEKRLKNKNDSLSVKDFDVAIMNENSEVTADLADKDVEAQYFNTLKYVEAMSNGAWKKNPKILKEMRGDKGEIEDFIFRPDFHIKSIHLIYAESKEGKKKYLNKFILFAFYYNYGILIFGISK